MDCAAAIALTLLPPLLPLPPLPPLPVVFAREPPRAMLETCRMTDEIAPLECCAMPCASCRL